jgi:hypothetical protein
MTEYDRSVTARRDRCAHHQQVIQRSGLRDFDFDDAQRKRVESHGAHCEVSGQDPHAFDRPLQWKRS